MKCNIAIKSSGAFPLMVQDAELISIPAAGNKVMNLVLARPDNRPNVEEGRQCCG